MSLGKGRERGRRQGRRLKADTGAQDGLYDQIKSSTGEPTPEPIEDVVTVGSFSRNASTSRQWDPALRSPSTGAGGTSRAAARRAVDQRRGRRINSRQPTQTAADGGRRG